jgi:hypothetical protein
VLEIKQMECLIISGSGNILSALQELVREDPNIRVDIHDLEESGYYVPGHRNRYDCVVVDLSALSVRKPAYVSALRKREISRALIALDLDIDEIHQQTLREAGADACLMMHQIGDWLLPLIIELCDPVG